MIPTKTKEKPNYTEQITTAIKSHHSLAEAFSLYNKMVNKEGIQPDAVLYTILITACANSKTLDKAIALWKDARRKQVVFDLYLYNTMIAVYCNMGNMTEAHALVQEMEQCGIPYDLWTCNTLLHGHVRLKQMEGIFNNNHATYFFKLPSMSFPP